MREEEKEMKDYGQEFLDVIRKIKTFTTRRTVQKETKIYHGEYMMLISIYALRQKNKEQGKEGVQVGELSRHMYSEKSATSKMLHSVEAKGYIKRIHDPKDRRNVYVCLTKEGEQMIIQTQHRFCEFTKMILEKLGKEDAETLLSLLKRVCEIIEEEMKKYNL